MSEVVDLFLKHSSALMQLGFFLVAVVEAVAIYQLWRSCKEEREKLQGDFVQILKEENVKDKEFLEKMLPILSSIKERLDVERPRSP